MEEKIAVLCKTKDEWERVVFKLKPVGHYPWSDLTLDVCISTDDSGYGSIRLQEEDGYKIISAAEYLNEGGKDVSEFKVGDEVRFVKGGLCGDEHTKWWVNEGLILGNTYKIYTVSDKGNPKVTKGGLWHNKEHFELINNINKTQTTKENNMELNSSIRTVLVEENGATFETVEKFQKVFGSEIAENFTGAMILRKNMKTYSDEIKRLDDIEAKRLEKEEKDK